MENPEDQRKLCARWLPSLLAKPFVYLIASRGGRPRDVRSDIVSEGQIPSPESSCAAFANSSNSSPLRSGRILRASCTAISNCPSRHRPEMAACSIASRSMAVRSSIHSPYHGTSLPHKMPLDREATPGLPLAIGYVRYPLGSWWTSSAEISSAASQKPPTARHVNDTFPASRSAVSRCQPLRDVSLFVSSKGSLN